MSATDSRPALPIHLPFDSISPSFSKKSPCVFQVLGYYLTSLTGILGGWLLCTYDSPRGASPAFPGEAGITAFGNRMRGSTSKMWFKGFGVLPQQAETAVSGNAGNRSFESLWEQRHCLPLVSGIPDTNGYQEIYVIRNSRKEAGSQEDFPAKIS